MDSQGIKGQRVGVCAAAAILVVAIAALVFLLVLRSEGNASAASAKAAAVKYVKFTIKCRVAVPADSAPCRGKWKMTGGFRDSGRVNLESIVRNEGAFFPYYASVLGGHQGKIGLSSGPLGVSHQRRGCPASAVFSVNPAFSSRRYVGWRGTSNGSCSKAAFGHGAMTRTDVFRVKITK